MHKAELQRDWYPVACAGLIAVWLCAWLLSFHNIYGWLTDDIYQFQRIEVYQSGGSNLLDIPWFHAYNWFIVTLPWLFHWSVQSHEIPQAWARTGEFRALILYTIVLHAVILGMLAYLIRMLCANRFVALATLVLFMTSPTFIFYSDLLDSRYLGWLAGLPAIIILLRAFGTVDQPRRLPAILGTFFLPGLLIGLGQSIHYTLTYFAGPVAVVYWCYALAHRWTNRRIWQYFLWFVAGLLAWIVPVEVLSLCFHPFAQSMLGVLWTQVHDLGSVYDKISDLATWVHFFLEDMGVPMMALVLAGAFIAYSDRLRPAYLTRFAARLMVWSCGIAVAYILITRAVAFYRQLAMYQVFFMLFAVVAIDVITARLFRSVQWLRIGVALGLLVVAAWVPSIKLMPSVFVAAQGLGRAVNAAHALAGKSGHVYFIEFYDIDLHPLSIVSREDFDLLKPGDVIVTDFPTTFFAKFPDIFALMHDTGPVASYPTEWCTIENWVEERTYWNFRRYQDEPESCNAQVYSVAALRKAALGSPLQVRSVTADSVFAAKYRPSWIFVPRNPATPVDRSQCCNRFPFLDQMWASDGTARRHWLQVQFSQPYRLSTVTIVPPNYFSPPAWDTVGRPDVVTVYGQDPSGHMSLLWRSANVRDLAIITANFNATMLSGVRIQLDQPPVEDQRHAIIFHQRLGPSPVGGLEYVRFPGYTVRYP